MEENNSLVGKEAQGLSILNKIGIGVFVSGILGLIELISIAALDNKIYGIKYVPNYEAFIFISFGLMLIGTFLFTYKRINRVFLTNFFKTTNIPQRLGLLLGLLGAGILIAAWVGILFEPATLFLWISMVLMAVGILTYSYGTYAGHTAGIKNNHVWSNGLTNRGVLGWIAGVAFTLFYIQLYWFSDTLQGLVQLFDPLSFLLRGKASDQWFVYGTMYSFLILFLGIKFMIKYRNNRYQLIRTISIIFFQLVFAYFLPDILESFNDNGAGYFSKDMKYVWPLNYEMANGKRLDGMAEAGLSGTFFFFWGLILFLVITPVITYFVGKRWYCSWVCGCGGLAETVGDGFRHLSSKKESAWKIERWVMHLVMFFILIMTIGALWPYFSGEEYVISFLTISGTGFYVFSAILLAICTIVLFFGYRKFDKKWLLVGSIITLVILLAFTSAWIFDYNNVFYVKSSNLKSVYGFGVGSAFAGVIGVGFYPILGNRVWCRFGCPMAGYIGLFQRFKSRFRITTNGSQCISCGNCSTYCEQGIDVRAYAQKGENIIRSSCVGCGICSAVCPRGVLKLENGPEEGRFEPNPLVITKDGVKLNK
ncbi:MAG: 4Fe-4S binding protein [Crocinitomicaceae bacterium]|nr:4Fe-4S binding protein [Crocinitomicaceae bacterium]